MKTSELIDKVAELSQHHSVKRDCNKIIYVQYKGKKIIWTSDELQYAGFFLAVDNEEYKKLPYSYKLYMLLSEYSMTPVKKRDESKKYNVIAWKDPKGMQGTSYWYRPTLGPLRASDKKDNDDDDQQWTLAQIKEYGLEKFERVEVQDD